ncbi:MAG: undecaprenyl-phosphate glucose phosphotransferase [Crocinitomicaceae bacterium]|jgi:undecaprenyl-phosphate galactose phosphotransferase/putative colanic acid biosynthesis UDP-glucose lipid carrier transferase|nr:undecaprenyl-phosphate glucose phosphotransferase [Crocinitomicaceae bacterium]
MSNKRNQILTKSSKYIKLFLLMSDFFVLNFSFVLSLFIIFKKFSLSEDKNIFSLVLFANLIWILLIGVFNAYQIMRIEPVERILSRSIKMILSEISILFLVVYTLEFSSIPKLFILIFSVLFIFINITIKVLSLYLLRYIRMKGMNNKNVVIVGVNKNGLELERILKKEVSFGYKVLGFFTVDEQEHYASSRVIGHVDDIFSYIETHDIDEVYFASTTYPEKKTKDLISFCEKQFVRFKIIPNFKQYTLNRHVNIDFYDDLPILILRKEPLENLFNKTIKRIFDITFSMIILILIMPWLYPIVFIVQKLTNKGPVLFIQLRSGQDNRIFKCYKFRTMRINDQHDQMGTLDNDPRITRFGKILRKTRIDELPQFFNVLLGHMSVVGPRPHMLKHTEEYSKLIDEFLVRHYVKPGITGWAQTTGYIDESRKLQEMQDKVKNDIYYIENWSFMLDMKIIFLTIYNVFKGDKNAK